MILIPTILTALTVPALLLLAKDLGCAVTTRTRKPGLLKAIEACRPPTSKPSDGRPSECFSYGLEKSPLQVNNDRDYSRVMPSRSQVVPGLICALEGSTLGDTTDVIPPLGLDLLPSAEVPTDTPVVMSRTLGWHSYTRDGMGAWDLAKPNPKSDWVQLRNMVTQYNSHNQAPAFTLHQSGKLRSSWVALPPEPQAEVMRAGRIAPEEFTSELHMHKIPDGVEILHNTGAIFHRGSVRDGLNLLRLQSQTVAA